MESILGLKKLSAVVTNRLFTAGVIFGSVTKWPRNESLLTFISDSGEVSPDSVDTSKLGA